jgi:VWFA-related protein
MTRLVALLLLSAAGALADAPEQEAQDRRAPAPLLHISAVAFDREGRPVGDLKASDLEVWIGGYRVPIRTLTVVTSSDAPAARSIVLLLDDRTIAPDLIPRAREIARLFVNRMAPGDQIAIVPLHGERTEFSGDRARLLRSIDDAHLFQPAGVERLEDIGAHVFEMIAALSRQLVERQGGRKIIVGIGAGRLFDTPIPPPTVARSLRAEWTEAMRATASAGAHVYVIDPAGLGAAPLLNGATGFARETGGHAFLNTNDYNGAVERIMSEASNYYVISVDDPPVRRSADLRELDVRVKRDGITVRARRALLGRP